MNCIQLSITDADCVDIQVATSKRDDKLIAIALTLT